MRILYLAYAQQKSFESFCDDHKTRFSWIDALLDGLIKSESATIALAVPVNNSVFQKRQKKEITLYGLPNLEERNSLKRVFKRLTCTIENNQINSFIDEVIMDFKPDIIQIFGSENPFGLIVVQQNIPVIIHIQGFLLVCLRKWGTGISRWQQFRYSSLIDLILMRGSFHGFYIFRKRAERERIILEKCKYFLGRTSFDKRIVSLLSPDSKYFHCEEFIRREFFEVQWDCPLEDKVTCVSILKGTTYKGIDLLIEAFILLKKYSSFTYEFKICGVSENEEFTNILKKKYRKTFDLSKINFLGNLKTSELIAQLNSSNIYIHPSYIENSPNSVCEAMALGMPIIATNVGGVSSLIENEVEGILIQEGEPYSMASAVIELTSNFEKAKQLGFNARVKAFERHNPNEILERMLRIYNTEI